MLTHGTDPGGELFRGRDVGGAHGVLGDRQLGDPLHRPHRVGLVQEPPAVGVGEQGAQRRLGPRHRRRRFARAELGQEVLADVAGLDRRQGAAQQGGRERRQVVPVGIDGVRVSVLLGLLELIDELLELEPSPRRQRPSRVEPVFLLALPFLCVALQGERLGSDQDLACSHPHEVAILPGLRLPRLDAHSRTPARRSTSTRR